MRELCAASPAAAALIAILANSCGSAAPHTPMDALPGAEAMPAATTAALAEALAHRDPRENTHTRFLRADGSPRFTNRLLLEGSPYLKEHAHNPVNWYPWGDEAFDAARRLGRPVLLSIGYSTCHWCHVMEAESFEDEEIARYLNEHYVAIKVDREQRPDLDSIYMTAVEMISGRGGWPMTLWLTAGREPFHAGTYFPPRDGERGGSRGFLPLLVQLSDVYRDHGSAVATTAGELATRVRVALAPPPAGSLQRSAGSGDVFVESVLPAALARFDADHGGPRGAPKFPSALPLRALLRHQRRSGDERALAIVTKTLEGMTAGGIHDHLGGGFHRYSTDAAWVVPHFEKMLYDNALLAVVYLEAWQATGREEFAEISKEILTWAERDMMSADGTFFSATDADSPSPDGATAEGRFFTWTPAQTLATLGTNAAPLFDAAYGVTATGNIDGGSVLHVAVAPQELARQLSRTSEDVQHDLAQSRDLLRNARENRPHPQRDDKIVTAWNALMISAAAKAALAFDDRHDRDLAARAADVLMEDFPRNRHLPRSRLGDQAQPEGFLDDYAFLEAAMLDLYEAGDGDRRLEQAIALDAVVEKDFEDPDGGFYRTPAGRTDLLVREKPLLDGAEPSGNSVAILNALRLAELTGQPGYRERADKALRALNSAFVSTPLSVGDGLLALDFASDTPKEIVLVTATDRTSLEPFLGVLASTFVPNRIVVTVTAESPARPDIAVAYGKLPLEGRPTAYVCEGHVCDPPTTDAAVFTAQLRRTGRLPPAR